MTQFRNIEYYWTDPDWRGNRMVFLSGPRQVGKTELVRTRLCLDSKGYFNWDVKSTRLAYGADENFFLPNLQIGDWICFDEIHKRNHWKDILKGAYDLWKDQYQFVIPGSARLDLFKKHGDSLVGRYFTLHHFPLNLGDFHQTRINDFSNIGEFLEKALDAQPSEYLEPLLSFGGFPESLFKASANYLRRWEIQHRDLIISEDLPQLTQIQELDKLELLLERLRAQVGSPLSMRKTAMALETNHHSIARWIGALEKVQLVFCIQSFSSKLPRVNNSDTKVYMVDWMSAKENLFENFVAAALFRACTLWRDVLGRNISLHTLRSSSGKEVDFLLAEDQQPILLLEIKEGAPEGSSLLNKAAITWNIPAAVVTKRPGYKVRRDDNTYLLSWDYLGQLLP